MRLSVSNLALPMEGLNESLAQLSRSGVTGIEVAPTKIANWDMLTHDTLRNYRRLLLDHGLTVSSMQAILFGMPDIALLGDQQSFDRLKDHISRVSAIGVELGAAVAVFGAPKQRARGEMDIETAFELGSERLRLLAEVAHQNGMIIGLEPVPAAYGGDFLPKWQDVDAMVRHVGHSALRVHLDTACVFLGEGDISEAIRGTADVLAHFHIAEPALKPFDAPVADHARAARTLHEIDFLGWLAIEMMADRNTSDDAVLSAVAFVRQNYQV